MIKRHPALTGLDQGYSDPFSGVQAQYTKPQSQYFQSIGAVSPGSSGSQLPEIGFDMMAQTNPQWARWFDTIQANTGGQNTRFAPQPDMEDSNQFQGYSANPLPARLNQAVMGLQDFQTGYNPNKSIVKGR